MARIDHSVHEKNIRKLFDLKPGEFLPIDHRIANTFRGTLNYFLRHEPKGDGISYRHVRVSKDQVYFFKVDLNLKIG